MPVKTGIQKSILDSLFRGNDKFEAIFGDRGSIPPGCAFMSGCFLAGKPRYAESGFNCPPAIKHFTYKKTKSERLIVIDCQEKQASDAP